MTIVCPYDSSFVLLSVDDAWTCSYFVGFFLAHERIPCLQPSNRFALGLAMVCFQVGELVFLTFLPFSDPEGPNQAWLSFFIPD